MAIKDDITVMAGKPKLPAVDIDTKSTIKHATTGKVYANEQEANDDVNNPETSTTKKDIVKDVAIKVNKLPDIFGGTS